MKSFKFTILSLFLFVTCITFGSCVLIRKNEYQKTVNRMKKLDLICSLDSEKKRNEYRFEMLRVFKQKLIAMSQTLFSLGMPLESQREFWLGRAKKAREEGLAVLSVQYENFVKYELEQVRNNCGNKNVPSDGVAR